MKKATHPPPNGYMHVMVSIRSDTHGKITALARKYGISAAEFVTRCIDLGIYVINEQEAKT